MGSPLSLPRSPGSGGHDDRHEQPHEVPSPGHKRGARKDGEGIEPEVDHRAAVGAGGQQHL